MSIFNVAPITHTNDTVENATTFNNEIKNKMTDIDAAFTAEIAARGAGDSAEIAARNAAIAVETAARNAVPMCRVYRSIDQATYTGEQTIIVFDLEDIDTDTMHSLVTNPSRITINTAGTYLIGYSCSFQVRGAGRRLANLVKNSAALSFSQSEAALSTEGANILSSSLLVPLALGDVIELNIYQTSDGYINIIGGTGASSTCMWATRISP